MAASIRNMRLFANLNRFRQYSWNNSCTLVKYYKSPTFQARNLFTQSSITRASSRVLGNCQSFCTASAKSEDYHSIIQDDEKATGPAAKHEFQAETRMLLDIVAKSLYSEREVFIRELISNANDAMERLRYHHVTGVIGSDLGAPLEIHIGADKDHRTLTIQDTGIGMTEEEMVDNLGTIARSGSKGFMQELKEKGDGVASSIIGQFGVGFYAAFMVAEKVEVFSLSHKPGSKGLHWVSDGCGTYEVAEAEGVKRGTKIVVHLKPDAIEFADVDKVNEVIKKYSNYVSAPIFFNGKRINRTEALWMMEPKDVSDTMHEEFYRFLTGAYDRPRYWLQYKADAPLNIRSVFYIPDTKPTMLDMGREGNAGVALYSRKVLIQDSSEQILPKWMRFVKGVVDSEDIPLNLSRELLQNSALISKLRLVLTNRLMRFFQEQAKKDPEKYDLLYKDFGLFFREGILMTADQGEKEEIAKLLRFESSKMAAGEKVCLEDYAGRMEAGQRDIFYLAAPSRELAETSPYFDAVKEKDFEVLFCYEPYDELVLMQLRQFDRKNLTSVEKEMVQDKEKEGDTTTQDDNSLSDTDVKSLCTWMKQMLGTKATNVKVTRRLSNHPCVVTVAEMGAARHFVRTAFQGIPEDQRYSILQPTLEINPSHSLIKKLSTLMTTNEKLGRMVAEQIFDNAMIAAGLIEDPRVMINRLNDVLTLALEKH
ncbi:PREDICTED: heat shock protein 75 kDa, mitochondrial-like [Priapulus caudatus]|uniref:Heat shock protein 75 kDa, mitochondrial-like n=1 Tax=Priapulus caudatus TaxID=37621 RepID=A0ABM1ETH2_PRICU|nr:PREDICTED: heat shock protein 75 kDa, mitochondrial-like [Priapulus caudatus]